jgi:hypothetical protein
MATGPTGLGPKNDCAGETSSNCKRQTRPLVREGAPWLWLNTSSFNSKIVNNCTNDNELILPTMTDKRQTRPLVREGAPHVQDSNFQTRRNIWSCAPAGARRQDGQTDWPSVAMWLWLEHQQFSSVQFSSVQFSVGDSHEKFVVEEELEVDLWRLDVWIEDFVCCNYSNLEIVTINCSYN